MKEHLCNILAVAEAMSANMHWNFLEYSIPKEMLADLRIIATTWEKQTAAEAMEKVEEMMSGTTPCTSHAWMHGPMEDVQSGGSATVLLEKEMQEQQEQEVKIDGSKDEEEK